MALPIHQLTSVELLRLYRLRIGFDDGSSRDIGFEPILERELYGPLRDPGVFAKVEVDPEVRTLAWPNGADFDPAIVHDWPEHQEAMRSLVTRWVLPVYSSRRTPPWTEGLAPRVGGRAV